MGNKQVCIGLHLDKQSYEAGSTMKGRVYLSVDREGQRAQAVHLLLVGKESTTIRYHQNSRLVIKKAKSSIVEMEVPLTHFPSSVLIPGQYEFPFEWELPSNLPSSMQCGCLGESRCKINYNLTASLYDGRKSCRPFGSKHSSKQAICVTARPSQVQTNTGIITEPAEFRVCSCFFNRGHVTLGWDMDAEVASPQSSVEVGILGCNESGVDIPCLQAKWIENISWTARGRRKETTRTLAEAKISTVDLAHWHSVKHRPRPHLSHVQQAADHNESRPNCRVVTHLNLPPDARDTYCGSLIRVRHALIVSAVTPAGCFVTTPESSALVQVQRNTVEASSIDSSEAHATPIYDMGDPIWADANILPDDWSPHEAEVAMLPPSAPVVKVSRTDQFQD